MRYILLLVSMIVLSLFAAAPSGEQYNVLYHDGEYIEGGIRYQLYHITTNVNLDPEYLADIAEFVGDVVIFPSSTTQIAGKYKPWSARIGTSLSKFPGVVKSIYIPYGVVNFKFNKDPSRNKYCGRFFWGVTNIEEIVFNKTDIVYPCTYKSEYGSAESEFYYADECFLFRSCKGLRRAVLGKAPRFTVDSTGKTMIADDVIRNIAFSVEELYYPKEFADDWESVLKLMGNTCRYGAYTGEWTNVGCVLPESGNLGKDAVYITAYNLASAPQDKAIANVEIAGDTAIDSFVFKDGKVFDCAVRIVNKSEKAAKVSLPKGFVYEKFRGTKPLHIPAASTNLLTITRTTGNTFLISREELVTEVVE